MVYKSLEAAKILDTKNISKAKKIILDIGSGYGENTFHLAKNNPNKFPMVSK